MIRAVRVLIDPELKAARKQSVSTPVDFGQFADPNIRALTQQLRSQIAVPGVSGGPSMVKGSGSKNPKRTAAAQRGWQTRRGQAPSVASLKKQQQQQAAQERQAKLDAEREAQQQRTNARQDRLDQQHEQDRAAQQQRTSTQDAQKAQSTALQQQRAAQQAQLAAAKAALAAQMRRASVPPPSSTPAANVQRFNALGQIIQNGEASNDDWANWAYEGVVAGAVDPQGVLSAMPKDAAAKFQQQLNSLRKPDASVLTTLAPKIRSGVATQQEQAEYLAQQIALGKAPQSALSGAGAVGQLAANRLEWLTGQKSLESKAGGADRNQGGAEKLRRYWVHGPGAAKIGWGSHGDFMRCVSHLSKYVRDAKGYCADRHKEATGEWPGPNAHGGGHKGLCCDDCGSFRTNVAGLGLDAMWRPEFKAGALYGGERTPLDPGKLRQRALHAWITRRGGAQALAPGNHRNRVAQGQPAPQRLSQAPGVLPGRQAALQQRIAQHQQSFSGMPSGGTSTYKPKATAGGGNRGPKTSAYVPQPPVAPQPPDPSVLAPGSGVKGGRTAPLTDKEFATRQKYWDDLRRTPEWKVGGPHDTSVKFWDGRSNTWTPARQALHIQLLNAELDRAQARGVGYDGHAVVLGGLSGSGKSTLLRDSNMMSNLGVDVGDDGVPNSHIVVSADTFKEQLVAAGGTDVMPGLTPMESAHLVHEESRLLGEALLRAAAKQHMNIVYDGTLGNYYLDRQRIGTLEQTDPRYDIDGLFADVSVDTAVQGVAARWRRGVDDYEVGATGDGGRPVPEGFIRSSAQIGPKTPDVPDANGDMVTPRSANRGVFQAFIDQDIFNRAIVVDNEGANRGQGVVVQDYLHPDLEPVTA